MAFKISDKIRIAVLENGLISTYTAREGLMKDLVSQGFDVYVLTHTNQFQNKAEALGINVVNIGSGNCNPISILKYLRNLYEAFKVIRPNVCLTFSIRPAIWGNLIARHFRIPVITNITGIGPLFSSKSSYYKLIRFIYPFALGKTKAVFFQNTDDRQEFIKHSFVSAQKSIMIPGSGVDYVKFAPRHAEIKKEKEFTFLFIGRLIKDKGVFEFIEAARKIKGLNPEIKFKIIGPLWRQSFKSNTISEETIHRWVKEEIIEYLGEKTDVRNDIATADCIVLPSYREGTSNVLLEASSMEKPCIASNVPGCKEVIDHNISGFLCEVQNSLDLAEKMRSMFSLESGIRNEMGKKARQKMIREFDKKIVIERYIQEIQYILSPTVNPVFSIPRIYNDEKEIAFTGMHLAG